MNRRTALILGAGAAGAAVLPLKVWAATPEEVDAAIAEFTGGAEPTEGGVEITAPEIAENGNTVPVEVSAEGASSILLLAPLNPSPGVATFHFGDLSATSQAATRIRLAGTQELIAVAKLGDGKFAKTTKNVKVTIGGCGG